MGIFLLFDAYDALRCATMRYDSASPKTGAWPSLKLAYVCHPMVRSEQWSELLQWEKEKKHHHSFLPPSALNTVHCTISRKKITEGIKKEPEKSGL